MTKSGRGWDQTPLSQILRLQNSLPKDTFNFFSKCSLLGIHYQELNGI